MPKTHSDYLSISEIIMVLLLLVLMLTQTSVLGIPTSQLAGIGALYLALLGSWRELWKRRHRESSQSQQAESDSQTVYNIHGDYTYIDGESQIREQSDRSIDITPIEERSTNNRHLDEFEEKTSDAQKNEKLEQTNELNSTQPDHAEEPSPKQEREVELEQEVELERE